MLVLDTDIVAELERGNARVISALKELLVRYPGNLVVPSSVYAEVYYGLLSCSREKAAEGLERLESYEVLAFDKAAAQVFSKLKSDLEKTGQIIPVFDLVTSAIVIQAGAVLVSNDEHFKRVSGLKLVSLNA